MADGQMRSPSVKFALASLRYSTRIGVCKVCHAGVPALNPYGSDFGDAHSGGTTVGQALGMIKSLDSDGDGFSNLAEIRKGTWPGKATSHP